jgi:S-adenosylmethionine hydrolase
VQVGDGQSILVGPDNGLLAAAVAMVGGADRAVTLTNPEYQLPAPGPTFAGRDVFAPAAAHLCNGVALDELGDPIDPNLLVPGILPVSREEKGTIVAEVLWIDRFGNVQLNVDPDEIDGWDERIRLRLAAGPRTARRVDAYADLKAGEVGLVVDSYGLVSIAVDRGAASVELDLHAGDPVTLEPAERTIAVRAEPA